LNVVSLWSGGKDSCLASYEAINKGFNVSNLLSFSYKDGSVENRNLTSNILSFLYKRIASRSPSIVSNVLSFIYKDLSKLIPHDVSPQIIAMQAKALGIPIVQIEVSWNTFEQQIKSILKTLKQEGIEGAVSGIVPPHFPLDSSEKLREFSTLKAHKDWMHRICGELGIKPITPLWKRNPDQILAELVEKGFETIIVVVDSNYFGKEWLGRKIDYDFLEEVRKLNRNRSMHVAGSTYHTLVTDGPLFQKKLEVTQSRKRYNNGYYVLDISKMDLVSKN